jgi:hypothetical protein
VGDDFRDVGRMQAPEHFGEVRDRASAQQLLRGLEHDIGLRLPTLGLVAERLAQQIPFRQARPCVGSFRLYWSLSRLHV